MKRLFGLAAFGAVLACAPAQAQQITAKVGVLTDMSSLYADLGGQGSVVAAQMAAADFMKDHPNMKVEVISGDHQNKPDVGTNLANQWYDVDKVDVIVDVLTSSVALAVSQVAANKDKLVIVSGAAASDLTGPKCNANTLHWAYDTWMLANGTGTAMVKNGGDTWFFITADYAFGHALERDTSAVVTKNGGKVVGAVRAPINTSDFSSFLLQAQASKAKVIGLANAGGDTINSIKQASQFGIVKGGQKLAGLLVFASDVNALGLETAQGLSLTETWYWDQNDVNRAWAKRWTEQRKAANKYATMIHAGVYSSVIHYLKARLEMGGNPGGKAVTDKMKSMPTDDILFGKGTIDVNGRKRHDAYLYEVKKPSESKHPGDFYNLKATIPAKDAFRDPKDSGCSLVKS